MNKAWERFVVWMEREKPGFFLYYGEDSEETKKLFNRFLRQHVKTAVEVIKGVVSNRPDIAEAEPWQCECGSFEVNEVFMNEDRTFPVHYDTNRPYATVHWPNVNEGWTTPYIECAKCTHILTEFEEIQVLNNMGEIDDS